MSRRIFSGLSQSGDSNESRSGRPWWQAMSFVGWMLLLVSITSTITLLTGLLYGETALLLPAKSRGFSLFAGIGESPFAFVALMIANALISFIIWGLFISWLGSRKN